MKTYWTRAGVAVLLALGIAGTAKAAAPASPQGMITGKGYFNIPGTTVATLTNNAKFPNQPDAIFAFPYFEWNATGDIFTPAPQFGNDYGGQIVGYFYPPTTGTYVFYIAADDNASLFLSTNSLPENKRLIARETTWSNAREYLFSGGNSDLTAKDSSFFTATEWPVTDPGLGGAVITLQANQPYYIEALFKEGGGGDYLSVAVADPQGQIDPNSPIPGQFLATERTFGPVMIVTQPQSQTVAERGSVTLRVLPDGTPPYSFQWRKGGTDIPDATNMTFTVTGAAVADSGAQYSVVVTGAEGNVTSQNAVLTVAPDTVLPRIISAKGSPALNEVTLTFSEPVDPVTAAAIANYPISSAAGALNVTGATVSPSGTSVTLTTANQTLGTKYTILVSNVKDTAATANSIAANSKVVFFPAGKLLEENGMIVVEAENYDRNLDGLWVRDTTRGTPSGGASMVNPNGAGGNESGTKLEYDAEFTSVGTFYVWLRASGDNGNDDSVWIHINGERPFERASGNGASLTGFQPQADFVWRSDSQDGPDPFTVDVFAPGLNTIAIARREDGSFVDKLIFTTDSAFTPTGFGPPETRQGAPGAPTVSLSAPANDAVFATGANIALSSTSAGDSGLLIDRVVYSANGEIIGESTTSPFNFTWTNAPAGIFAVRATAYDEIGQSALSGSSVITVGTPPPQALLVVGTASDPNLNASDAAIKTRLEEMGWQVTVKQAPTSVTADGEGKQLIIASSTINSGDVAAKFRDSIAPVLFWEQAVQDDFLTTLTVDGVDRGTLADQTQIEIVNASHPLAAGLSTGLKTTTTVPQAYSWGAPNANAVKIASIAGDPTRTVIYGYEKGAILADDTTPAPGRRVMFFSGDDGYANFTDDAKALFDAAVIWASGIEPTQKTSAKIAWVSFHADDETPASAAATAGFTRAPDVGYTDLLEAQGHEVTRIVTSGTPNAALLNAFDLVIISRSVPSGDYELAAETLAWNGITAPTMILGGYIIRANRLGLMTGNTIPDTTGPIKLIVADPDHPIFEGIELDASNTTVADFAELQTFNNIVQRGISVVTEPPGVGGTVLATSTDPAAPGAIIAEWEAGATLNNAAADTLAGDRLLFLTGTRENNGLTSQGAGIFDLTPTGAQLFLNAVNYMAGTVPGESAPSLAVSRSGNNITLTFEGTLQAADTITGTFTDVTSTSPHTVPADQPMRFYRAKR